jgi:glycosyltransferase involved in cell wall biosynthesis
MGPSSAGYYDESGFALQETVSGCGSVTDYWYGGLGCGAVSGGVAISGVEGTVSGGWSSMSDGFGAVSGEWRLGYGTAAGLQQQAGAPEGGGAGALRVIHVGQSMVRAGVEQWLKGLIRFLNPRRVRMTRCIATAPELIDPQVMGEMGTPVEVGQAESVRRAAADCDVLLCWGPADLGRWLNGSRPKLCVFVAHGEGIWTRRILEGCAPVIDHVVAVSDRVRQRVCNGLPSSVICNGVDTTHLARSRSRQATRRALGLTEGDFVVGYVGRYSPEKRPHVILEAVAHLPEPFKVLMVGWGGLQSELQRLASILLPGRCTFATARDYLGDYYHAMDALCMASEVEGFSLVVLEAMMCGVPVMATPVGCVPDVIVDRVNGIIIPGTVDSIGAAAQLLARYPAWARGLAHEARQFAEKNGHARLMAQQYEDLLERLWIDKFGSLTAQRG